MTNGDVTNKEIPDDTLASADANIKDNGGSPKDVQRTTLLMHDVTDTNAMDHTSIALTTDAVSDATNCITPVVDFKDVPLWSKLQIEKTGCHDSPPELIIIGDSLIRSVVTPRSINYCLPGGKVSAQMMF